MEKPLELTLTLHGLDRFNEDVDAMVFARKFKIFLDCIRHSDKLVNGKIRYAILLSDLRKNTATASVREQVINKGPPPVSGIGQFADVMDDLYHSRPRARTLPPEMLKGIRKLAAGAGESFAFGELKSSRGLLVRIDQNFGRTIDSLEQGEVAQFVPTDVEDFRFSGTALSRFDGVLKEVDLRGDIKLGKLILTVGGREIDCVLNKLSRRDLKAALDSRVIAHGEAHYNRSSSLPVRFEIVSANPVKDEPGKGLERWRGAFRIPEDILEDWG